MNSADAEVTQSIKAAARDVKETILKWLLLVTVHETRQ
jgi:hypothetical protein